MRVLVLCTGNRWRSPLLARSIQALRPGWEVRSAGTHCSRPRADVPRAWRACVDGWVEPHVSRKAEREDVWWADVVVGVQRSHEAFAKSHKLDARVVVCKLADPAFQRVSAWLALARAVSDAAAVIVAAIEAEPDVVTCALPLLEA